MTEFTHLTTTQLMVKKLVYSQFESHFAQEAFPCVDRQAKATFDLSLHFIKQKVNWPCLTSPEIDVEKT